jgi:hypothetical protein
MSPPVHTYPRRVPPLYRLARALRSASVLALVLLILYTGSVAYSTSEITQSPPQVGSFTVGFGANNTVILAALLSLGNPGFYPIQAFSLDARVLNSTGIFLGGIQIGPDSLPGQSTVQYPITIYLPISESSPGASLLVRTQSLNIGVWGNATFGYLFPAGVTMNNTRSWGAPFSNLAVSVGNMSSNGTVPVTLSFQNQASLSESGSIRAAIVASNGITCGSTAWTINVGEGQTFDQTASLALASGCSPAGGSILAEYVTPGYTVPLPPEAIP